MALFSFPGKWVSHLCFVCAHVSGVREYCDEQWWSLTAMLSSAMCRGCGTLPATVVATCLRPGSQSSEERQSVVNCGHTEVNILVKYFCYLLVSEVEWKRSFVDHILVCGM